MNYDAASRLTTSISGSAVTTYTFDVNGNMTNINENGTRTTMTFDKENRVASHNIPGARQLTTFTYDGNGQKRREQKFAQIMTIIWDGDDYLGDTDDIPAIDPAPMKRLFHCANGIIYGDSSGYAVGSPAATRFDYLADFLGSVTGRTSSAAVVSSTRRFKPYGSLLSGTAVTQFAFGWTGNTGSRYTAIVFSGQYQAREHYASKCCRWVSGGTLPGGYVYKPLSQDDCVLREADAHTVGFKTVFKPEPRPCGGFWSWKIQWNLDTVPKKLKANGGWLIQRIKIDTFVSDHCVNGLPPVPASTVDEYWEAWYVEPGGKMNVSMDSWEEPQNYSCHTGVQYNVGVAKFYAKKKECIQVWNMTSGGTPLPPWGHAHGTRVAPPGWSDDSGLRRVLTANWNCCKHPSTSGGCGDPLVNTCDPNMTNILYSPQG